MMVFIGDYLALLPFSTVQVEVKEVGYR
ncbi:hypothetical protein HKBW3S25_00594, partial [Candidatus Hakubella thermalkaliphila]